MLKGGETIRSLESSQTATGFTPAERQALRYADLVTGNHFAITDQTFEDLRRHFIPAPDTARAVLAGLGDPHGDLLDALSAELTRQSGVRVPVSIGEHGVPAGLKFRAHHVKRAGRAPG